MSVVLYVSPHRVLREGCSMKKTSNRKRPELIIVGHFVKVNGERKEIDPRKTDIADRCKLAIAEMLTGNQYELV